MSNSNWLKAKFSGWYKLILHYAEAIYRHKAYNRVYMKSSIRIIVTIKLIIKGAVKLITVNKALQCFLEGNSLIFSNSPCFQFNILIIL